MRKLWVGIMLAYVFVLLFLILSFLEWNLLLMLLFSSLLVLIPFIAFILFLLEESQDDEDDGDESEELIDSLDEWVLQTLNIFKVLSNRIRAEILFLLENRELSINEIWEILSEKGYRVSLRAVRYHVNALVFHRLVLWRQVGADGEIYFFLTDLGYLMVDEINYLADKLYDMGREDGNGFSDL